MALSREKISAAFLFLILAVMIGAVIYVALSLRTDPVKETLENDEVIKVLVVINDGQGNCLSTDLLAYYPPFRKGALFDIPGNIGDIFKSIDRTDRIDAIYREKGIASYVTEVSRLTDTIIPFTVELSLDNLSTLTDMLGGLNLFISAPVDSLSPAGERWLLPSGQINLDGDKIKTYMTYLLEGEGESELDDRRQSVIVSLLSAINENRKQTSERPPQGRRPGRMFAPGSTSSDEAGAAMAFVSFAPELRCLFRRACFRAADAIG